MKRPTEIKPLPTYESDFVSLLICAATRDPTRPRSLFEALRRGLVPQRFMAEALAIEKALDARPRCPSWAMPPRNWKDDTSNSWDDVVKAYEEDR